MKSSVLRPNNQFNGAQGQLRVADIETVDPMGRYGNPRPWYGEILIIDIGTGKQERKRYDFEGSFEAGEFDHFIYDLLSPLDYYIDNGKEVRPKVEIFFHNKKYDRGFILYRLQQLGWKADPQTKKEVAKANTVYTTDQVDEFYYEDKHCVYMMDTKNIITGSLASWGSHLGSDMLKGETPITDEYYEPGEQEWAYLDRDIDITYEAFKGQRGFEMVSKGLYTASSIAQDSLHQLLYPMQGKTYRKGAIRRRAGMSRLRLPKYDKRKYTDEVNKQVASYAKWVERQARREKYKLSKYAITAVKIQAAKALSGGYEGDIKEFKSIEELFEEDNARIVTEQVNFVIQGGMKGGISYVNPEFKNKLLGAGTTIDCNSMYPSVLYDNEIPYRVIGYEDLPNWKQIKRAKYWLAIVEKLHIKCKPDKHPFYKPSTKFGNIDTYERELNIEGRKHKGVDDLQLTSVEYEQMKDVYEIIELKISRVYYAEADDNFTQAVRKHLDKWKKVKEDSSPHGKHPDPMLRQFAKMQLNTLWGRWGMFEKLVKNGGQVIDVGDKQTNMISAIFVTAYARVKLNQVMNLFWDVFVYSDTDSVHVVFNDRVKNEADVIAIMGDRIDDSLIGKWKLEHSFTAARYIKPKTYCHEIGSKFKAEADDGTIDVEATTAGADVSGQIKSLDDFVPGKKYKTKKSFENKSGLTVIQDTDFEL